MLSRESLASRAQAMPAKQLKRQKRHKNTFCNFFIVNNKKIDVTKDIEKKNTRKVPLSLKKRPARL